LINDVVECNNTNIDSIQQYLFDTVDSIILYSDMNKSIKEIKSLIEIISSTEEVYALLDKIENTIESIVMNISEDVSFCIIHQRIAYVRSLVSTLPADYNNYAEISLLILDLMESIKESIDFKTLYSNIQKLISTDTDNIQPIRCTILSIITGIGNGESNFIINERIKYLQTLINKLV
jgi:hypothetical protein